MKQRHIRAKPPSLAEWLQTKKAEGYFVGYVFGESPHSPKISEDSPTEAHATMAVWLVHPDGKSATWSNVAILYRKRIIHESPQIYTHAGIEDFVRQFALFWGYKLPGSMQPIDVLIVECAARS